MEATSEPLLGFDRVWLVAILGEDKVVIGNHMVQELHTDLSTGWWEVRHHVEEGVAILYEECILGVGHLLIPVLEQIVKDGGLVCLDKKAIRRAKCMRNRQEGVTHEFFEVDGHIQYLGLKEQLEGEVALLLVHKELQWNMKKLVKH